MRLTAPLFILVLALAACGIKPGDVDPPLGDDGRDHFPRTYPDPTGMPDPERLIR